MIHIVPTEYSHLEAVAEDIRKYDAFELMIFTGKSPLDALDFIFRQATRMWTVFHNDKPAVVFGYNVTDLIHRVAAPFMVATNYAASKSFLFARHSCVVAQYFAGYYLVNYVQAANALAIKWLEWLGFYVAGPENFQDVAQVRRFSKDSR